MWDVWDSPVVIHAYATHLAVLPVLSCPSHVGWMGQSCRHTHIRYCTWLCPTCPVLPFWDGQDIPMNIHPCTTALGSLPFPCGMDRTILSFPCGMDGTVVVLPVLSFPHYMTGQSYTHSKHMCLHDMSFNFSHMGLEMGQLYGITHVLSCG